MKDSELRGIVLRRLYDERRRGKLHLSPQNPLLVESLSLQETLRICKQLEQHGLVEAKLHSNMSTRVGGYDYGMVEITARGADVAEGTSLSEIKIEFMQTNNVNIAHSTGVIVGDGNSQSVNVHFDALVRHIDAANVTEADKAEAKSQLRKFLENPVVNTIFGVAASALLGVVL